MSGTDQLRAVFSALADPTRRAILDELAERDATVTELNAPLPMFQRWTEVAVAEPDLRVHVYTADVASAWQAADKVPTPRT